VSGSNDCMICVSMPWNWNHFCELPNMSVVLSALVTVQHNEDLWSAYEPLGSVPPTCTRSVWKVSSHFEYLVNRSCGLDVTWQPVRGDLTAHPWTVTLLCDGHTVHKLSQWRLTAD